MILTRYEKPTKSPKMTICNILKTRGKKGIDVKKISFDTFFIWQGFEYEYNRY